MSRHDYLRECNNQGVPLEDFRLTFCDRCLQPECTRSTYGTSKFDQRTQTWVQRLFTEVPRMDPKDPRFDLIASQGFSPMDPEIPSQGSEWVDPRDAPKAKIISVPSAFIEPHENQEIPTPEALVELKAPRARPRTSSALPREVLTMNTKNNGEMYLPGATRLMGKPKKDPWAATEPQGTSEVVVQKGATVRLGSGSGVK